MQLGQPSSREDTTLESKCSKLHPSIGPSSDSSETMQNPPNNRLTSAPAGLALNYHLRSNSGSNGPLAKDCHRFLVVGSFNLRTASTSHSRTRRITDSGASTSNSTVPSR